MSRSNSSLVRLLALAAALALVQGRAQADGVSDDTPVATQWGLGLAVMYENKPYRDFDNKTEVLPVLSFENRWVRLAGPGIELKLGKSGGLSYGLVASYAGDGYKPGDSPYLAGMDKRHAGVWLGGRARYNAGFAQFSAEWSGDSSGYSQGQKLRLGVERRFAVGALGLTPRLSATWHDRKFVQYFYGVSASEARADRPAYQPGSAVDTELGLRLDYRLAPQQTLFMDLGVSALGSAIKDSPLVERSSVPELRLGYLYRF